MEGPLGSPEIITERLSLTRLLPGDAAALFEYRSDPEVSRYQFFVPGSLEDARQVEVGFTVAPGHQRMGLATEAVEGLLGHLLRALQKHRVFASVDSRNERSVAFLERVGMRQEAHLRESCWFKGEWVDDIVFAIEKRASG
jgi:RimJ/RimL family protein N-acetyltransferase